MYSIVRKLQIFQNSWFDSCVYKPVGIRTVISIRKVQQHCRYGWWCSLLDCLFACVGSLDCSQQESITGSLHDSSSLDVTSRGRGALFWQTPFSSIIVCLANTVAWCKLGKNHSLGKKCSQQGSIWVILLLSLYLCIYIYTYIWVNPSYCNTKY